MQFPAHKLMISLLGLGLVASATACKKKSKDDSGTDDEETTSVSGSGGGSTTGSGDSSTVPQVGAISLSSMGTEEGAALLGDGETCKQEGMGAMGMALGAACHTSPLAARFMLGVDDGDFNGDGKMDCNDLAQAKAEGKDPGLMLHLLCEDVMVKNDNVVSLAFGDDQEGHSFAVGFTDFPNDTTAAGSWTRGDAASYPADIRIWKGTTFDDFKGQVALGLTDVNNGTIYLDSRGGGGGQFQTVVSFANKASTADCAATPNADNCHNQDIKMYTGDGEVTFGPPNGFHLRIYADDKTAPTFIALEGRFRYTEATAARFADRGTTCPGSELVKMRSLYFQTVQKGNQVWGHFAFRDGDGNLLSCALPGGFNPFAQLGAAEGLCQDRGSPLPVACSDITPQDYADLWEGEDTFENVTASPIGDIWDGAPTERGVCTIAGCGAVK